MPELLTNEPRVLVVSLTNGVLSYSIDEVMSPVDLLHFSIVVKNPRLQHAFNGPDHLVNKFFKTLTPGISYGLLNELAYIKRRVEAMSEYPDMTNSALAIGAHINEAFTRLSLPTSITEFIKSIRPDYCKSNDDELIELIMMSAILIPVSYSKSLSPPILRTILSKVMLENHSVLIQTIIDNFGIFMNEVCPNSSLTDNNRRIMNRLGRAFGGVGLFINDLPTFDDWLIREHKLIKGCKRFYVDPE